MARYVDANEVLALDMKQRIENEIIPHDYGKLPNTKFRQVSNASTEPGKAKAKPHPGTCVLCGKDFMGTRPQQKYCSFECMYNKMHRIKYKGEWMKKHDVCKMMYEEGKSMNWIASFVGYNDGSSVKMQLKRNFGIDIEKGDKQ